MSGVFLDKRRVKGEDNPNFKKVEPNTCEECGKLYERQRKADGRFESTGVFKVRKFCYECGKKKNQPNPDKPYSTHRPKPPPKPPRPKAEPKPKKTKPKKPKPVLRKWEQKAHETPAVLTAATAKLPTPALMNRQAFTVGPPQYEGDPRPVCPKHGGRIGTFGCSSCNIEKGRRP